MAKFTQLFKEIQDNSITPIKTTFCGDLSLLETTAKDNLVNAINEVKNSSGGASGGGIGKLLWSGYAYMSNSHQMTELNNYISSGIYCAELKYGYPNRRFYYFFNGDDSYNDSQTLLVDSYKLVVASFTSNLRYAYAYTSYQLTFNGSSITQTTNSDPTIHVTKLWKVAD